MFARLLLGALCCYHRHSRQCRRRHQWAYVLGFEGERLSHRTYIIYGAALKDRTERNDRCSHMRVQRLESLLPSSYSHYLGTNVPLAQSKPKLGFCSAPALKQMTLGASCF
jgi:hypothetical protein